MKWNLKNEEDLEKIKTRVQIAFRKYTGKIEGSEDAFQEVVEYFVAGKGKKQTIDQAVIDYLRRIGGRKGLPSYSEKQSLINANSIESESFRNLSDGCPRLHLESRIDVGRIIRMSRHWERAIMNLVFLEGYGQAEVGNFFGVSESRISQWIARIQKRISAKIKGEEYRARARKVEALLRPEAKRESGRLEQITFEGMEIGQSWQMESFNEASF